MAHNAQFVKCFFHPLAPSRFINVLFRVRRFIELCRRPHEHGGLDPRFSMHEAVPDQLQHMAA